MLDVRDRARFGQEALDHLAIDEVLAPQPLDRGPAAELRVLRRVHHRHGPLAELGDQAIGPELTQPRGQDGDAKRRGIGVRRIVTGIEQKRAVKRAS